MPTEKKYCTTSLLQWTASGGIPLSDVKYPDEKDGFISSRKVLLVGDPGVGKTTLIHSYLDWNKDSDFSLGACTPKLNFEEYYAEFLYWDQTKSIIFYDIPERYDLTNYNSCLYLGLDLIVFCFSIGDLNSLENVEARWCEELLKNFSHIPRMLLGLKSDIRNIETMWQGPAGSSFHVVSELDVHTISTLCNMSHYSECSAYTGEVDVCYSGRIGVGFKVFRNFKVHMGNRNEP